MLHLMSNCLGVVKAAAALDGFVRKYMTYHMPNTCKIVNYTLKKKLLIFAI